MIRASERRRAAPSVAEALRVHLRLARREGAATRRLRASLAALAVALLGWLLGVPLAWHAGSVLVAAVLGALLPVPRARERALATIAAQTGLAYETALELGSRTSAARTAGDGARDAAAANEAFSGDSNDPYGFTAAVQARAQRSARRVVPPARRPWWLTIAALAAALTLVPLLGFDLPTRGPSGGPGTTSDLAPAGDDRATDPSEATPEPSPEPSDEPTPIEGGDPDSAAARSPAEAGPESEGAALSRFLDDLRERPPETASAPEEGAGGAPPSGNGGPNPGEPQPGGSSGEPGDDATEGADSGESGGGTGGQPQDASSTEPSRAESPPAAQPQPADAEGSPEDGLGAGGETDAADGAQDAGEPGTPPEGDEGQLDAGDDASGGEAGTPPGGEAPNDVGGGAGASGGTTLPGDGLPGGELGERERLEGRLGNGPENLGGVVQLPGEGEGPTLAPAERAAYERAAEQAVREGRIPLEYREVIRNYFR